MCCAKELFVSSSILYKCLHLMSLFIEKVWIGKCSISLSSHSYLLPCPNMSHKNALIQGTNKRVEWNMLDLIFYFKSYFVIEWIQYLMRLSDKSILKLHFNYFILHRDGIRYRYTDSITIYGQFHYQYD